LACLLPQAERDLLRAKRAPAREVISHFHIHHIELHAWQGRDKWFNLTPIPAAEHKAMTPNETRRAAKVVRLDDKWRGFMRAVAKGHKPKPRRTTSWQKNRRRKRFA